MDLTNLIAVLAVGIFAETSYLAVKTIQPAKTKDSILIDTSVLIDGRIVSIARSGLIGVKLIVPRSVVRELQFMADRADHDKRERARYGLDVIEQLQAIEGVHAEVIDDGVTSQSGVDEQLMILARKWQAKLCTIDYNLNKSARVQGVQVININELAHALRVMYLPGEKFDVRLQQLGQDSHQAVGYLDDGTMVVVDHAKTLIGKTIQVEATRVLQTAAGKMMFAKHHEKVTEKPAKQKAVTTTATPSRQPKVNRQPKANRSESRPKQRSGNYRPHTAEDSLVDLANK